MSIEKEHRILAYYLKDHFSKAETRLKWLNRPHPFILGYMEIKPIKLIKDGKIHTVIEFIEFAKE